MPNPEGGPAAEPRPLQLFQVALKALLIDRGRLLLLRERASGLWELPGGRIETGELGRPHLEVLARELREELGEEIRYAAGRPCQTWVRELRGTQVFLVGYLCDWIGGKITLSDEHDELRWVTRDDWRSLDLAPGCDAVLREFWDSSGGRAE